MAVDTPQVQRKVSLWTLVATTVIGGLSYLLGAKNFAYGLGFGVLICVVNYRVIGVILDVAFRAASADFARVVSFVSYHIRFWLIVIILYIVIPRTHYLFGVGTFLGILLPKMIMGVFVVLNTEDEWWNREVQSAPPTPVDAVIKEKAPGEEGLRFPGLELEEKLGDNCSFEDSRGDLKL